MIWSSLPVCPHKHKNWHWGLPIYEADITIGRFPKTCSKHDKRKVRNEGSCFCRHLVLLPCVVQLLCISWKKYVCCAISLSCTVHVLHVQLLVNYKSTANQSEHSVLHIVTLLAHILLIFHYSMNSRNTTVQLVHFHCSSRTNHDSLLERRKRESATTMRYICMDVP